MPNSAGLLIDLSSALVKDAVEALAMAVVLAIVLRLLQQKSWRPLWLWIAYFFAFFMFVPRIIQWLS